MTDKERANSYDLVVIGSGPAGQKAALAAAKLRRRVALVERRQVMGGVCLHTGTIPSKTLREAVIHGCSNCSFTARRWRCSEYTRLVRVRPKSSISAKR